MTVNDGGFLNAVRDGSCTHVLNLLDSGGVDLEQRDQVSKKASCHKTHTKKKQIHYAIVVAPYSCIPKNDMDLLRFD